MPNPRKEISHVVDLIVDDFLSDKSSDSSSAAEFISSIESEFQSTLRKRLSALDTRNENNTLEGQSSLVDATLDQTIDSELDQPTLGQATLVSSPSKPIVRSGASRGSGDQQTANRSNDPDFYSETETPDGYKILGTLGKGGMGVVYEAEQLALGRTVAIKMILSGANASRDQLARFQREAESAARLTHPNIVAVHEVGEHNGLPFFSLEYVDGKSVSHLLRKSTLTGQDAAKLLLPVSRAVHYSHEMGVLHRDLKPQNILLTKTGVPKVADFGLAKRLDVDEGDEKTREGVVIGTPGYMAPEQARSGSPIGPNTDVYALGCILYYMITGRPPFKAPTPFETVRQSLTNDPVAPSNLQASLDKDLETICLKAMEKDPQKRYQTADEFADELQRFLNGEPIVARPITRTERAVKWCKRNPKVAMLSGLAASLLLCLMFGGIISAVVINQQRQAERVAREAAENSEQKAIASGQLAEDQAELALDTTRLVLYQAKDFFEGKPELLPLREKMIDSIVEGVEKIHAERYETDLQTTFVASADCQLGQIYLELGEFERAKKKLLASQRKLQLLNAEGKLNRADVSQMNISLALGDTYRKLGELDAAEQQYLKLLEQRTAYFANAHDSMNPVAIEASMSQVYGKLGSIYGLLGKPNEAMKYGLKSVEARRKGYEARPNGYQAIANLASALSVLSGMYERAGETEKMLACSSEALELQNQLDIGRTDVATLHNTAMKQKTLARQYLLLGNHDAALQLLHKATTRAEKALKAAADNQKVVSQAVDAYYWKGVAEEQIEGDPAKSFARAEDLQRALLEKSSNINSQGMLLKILARSGDTEAAVELADKMAGEGKMMSTGYAACGYALVSVHLEEPKRSQVVEKAIENVAKLVDHGYRDFDSLRKTDLDFEPLHKIPAYLSMLDEREKEEAK